MDEEPQVFSSNITRRAKPLKSDLADLLKVDPAEPVLQKKYEIRNTCEFKPKIKYYEPKRRPKLKVKTVRDIRHLFEKDVFSTLLVDLEKQQNILLRKIKAGSRDENTKTLTKNMLKCSKPVSRSAWQMLMNLNPEEYPQSTQFVLWNGKRIRVNGSKGGTCKFLFKYDLGTRQFSKKTKSSILCKSVLKRKGLLQNSLSVNFKPGPLGKKPFLDHSHQKYHVGGIEVQDLPKSALEIQPTVGKTIDPIITNFLHNMREIDGIISDKWAEFSVSTLATAKNETVTQIDGGCTVTFDLNYKCDQQRILMRRDVNCDFSSTPLTKTVENQNYIAAQDSVLTSEIRSVLHRIIDSVEISLAQDKMYTGEDDPRDLNAEPITNGTNIQPNELRVKRRYCNAKELERLDVTIIRLSESGKQKTNNTCPKAYCKLGCVCTSLECSYNLKRHCGRIECMFECKCDFSKYKVIDSLERDCSDLLPGLLKLDNEKSSKMAKEEQKFHHTVIVTPENSMLLKSKRRDWKSSRKYADFYSGMCLKNDNKPEKVATLAIEKLNLPNVEPWCMIHNLYKCFCKGRFTDNSLPDPEPELPKPEETNAENAVQKHTNSEDLTDEVERTNIKYSMKSRMFKASYGSHYYKMKEKCELNRIYQRADHDFSCRSARVKPYRGRKFSDEYYINANRKIFEMEQHDTTLRKRMINLINISISSDEAQIKNTHEPVSIKNISMGVTEAQNTEETVSVNKVKLFVPTMPPLTPAPSIPPKQTSLLLSPPLTSPPALQPTGASDEIDTEVNFFTNRWLNKDKLVAWVGRSYKQYTQRIAKNSLEPPKLGGLALHPWEFILSRYRDRKNVFLITTQTPYRIFMAVDSKHPFFKNCININDIRFADLLKYPVTVKQLLTNEKDRKGNFLILSGLPYCWELIGAVTKMENQQEIKDTMPVSEEDQKDNLSEMSTDTYHLDSEDSNTNSSLDLQLPEEDTITDGKTIEENNETSDSSRWFVMTVENDFDEIQFYTKGFFVKQESIIKAIHVARASGKTVRLSSQKCVDSTGPQFGIYAVPNDKESCVFVGPYEKNETLGIETVKKISDMGKQKRTKGVWITTKKIENFNVIDNPLSFIPPKNAPNAEMMTLAGEYTNNCKNTASFVETSKNKNKCQNPEKDLKGQLKPKVLKPIKIGKTNNFYQLAPNGTLKPITQQRFIEQKQSRDTTQQEVINKSLLNLTETSYGPLLSNSSSILKCIPKQDLSNMDKKVITINKKPVAEIAPHVKETNKCLESIATPKPKGEPTKKESGMFILKPEEINKRLTFLSNLEYLPECSTATDSELDMDIENFLATAEECEAPKNDILIISDDETDLLKERNVWIECKTVEGLGWIRGKKNCKNFVSFEFPGFKYTEFYKEEEAFAKLNQVLSRKIYIPKTMHLEWHVVECEQDLGTKQMLKQEELGHNFVMTKRGIRHQQELTIIKSSKNEAVDEVQSSNSKTEESKNVSPHNLEQPINISELEAESRLLEEEGEELWNTLKNNTSHSVIEEGLKDIGNLREEIAARLQRMVADK